MAPLWPMGTGFHLVMRRRMRAKETQKMRETAPESRLMDFAITVRRRASPFGIECRGCNVRRDN
jgi:hypothetical protein